MIATPNRPSRRQRTPGLLASWLLLLPLSGPALGADDEPLERILGVARDFAAETLATKDDMETRIEIGQLDNRLRLARCAHRPSAQFGPGARSDGNTTINVRCSEPVAWSIFVPARIERYREEIGRAHV